LSAEERHNIFTTPFTAALLPFTVRAALFTVVAGDAKTCKRKMHHFKLERCCLHQEAVLPLLAGKRGHIYCKSGVTMLEMPLTREERGTIYSKSKAIYRS
jgi:hypothetical protein